MRYVKVLFIVFLALLGLIFLIENLEVLKHPVKLKLDLYLVYLESAAIHLWVLVIFAFGLGAFVILLYFLYDHVKQRQIIRQLKHNIEIMGEELKRAGVAAEASAASLKDAAMKIEPPEQHKEE